VDEFEDVEPEPEWADGGIEVEVEPWVAHEQPERPLAWGAWLCDCDGCRLALVAASLHEPRLPIVLKTGGDRVVVTAEYAAEVWQAMGGLEALCYVQRDHIREVFVGQWWPAMPSERWWSLSRAESSKHAHRGLKYAVRSRSLRLGYGDWPDNPRLPKGPLAVRPVLRLVDEGERP
jgi:hypothetical protein